MNLLNTIKKFVSKKNNEITYNPNGMRLNFIGNDDTIVRQNLAIYRTWYIGDSDELLNLYTNQTLYGNASEPIYNRNKSNYFWGIASMEHNFKRVHSGVPNAIITTMVNIVGDSKIEIKNEEIQAKINKIVKDNDLDYKINQLQMPLTLVDGWGAYKVNFNPELSDTPIIRYYDAENVDFGYECGILTKIIFKDYYKKDDKNYVLVDIRSKSKGNSYVEYHLYQLEPNDEIKEVPLDTIDELKGLKNIEIPKFNHILGVCSRFFVDPLRQNYGRSVFAGKIDLFDDLDQILSQESQTVRVSTPVEYFPVDLLQRSQNGTTKLPEVFNRQYIKREGLIDGDGTTDGTIQVTQPMLNFDQYSKEARAKLDFILIGTLSPATMGIDLSKKDNAEAQREKEKVTIMTRNNIIDRQTKVLKELMTVALALLEFYEKGIITIQDYDINIKFNEFANPSFENEIQVLGVAWRNGEISTKKYVEMLYRDNLSEEEKENEITWLDTHRMEDNLDLNMLENEAPIRTDILSQEEDNNLL